MGAGRLPTPVVFPVAVGTHRDYISGAHRVPCPSRVMRAGRDSNPRNALRPTSVRCLTTRPPAHEIQPRRRRAGYAFHVSRLAGRLRARLKPVSGTTIAWGQSIDCRRLSYSRLQSGHIGITFLALIASSLSFQGDAGREGFEPSKRSETFSGTSVRCLTTRPPAHEIQPRRRRLRRGSAFHVRPLGRSPSGETQASLQARTRANGRRGVLRAQALENRRLALGDRLWFGRFRNGIQLRRGSAGGRSFHSPGP